MKSQNEEGAKKLKELRAKTGLSQTKFAEHFHLTVDNVRTWEQGVNRTPQHVLYMIEKIMELEGMIERK